MLMTSYKKKNTLGEFYVETYEVGDFVTIPIALEILDLDTEAIKHRLNHNFTVSLGNTEIFGAKNFAMHLSNPPFNLVPADEADIQGTLLIDTTIRKRFKATDFINLAQKRELPLKTLIHIKGEIGENSIDLKVDISNKDYHKTGEFRWIPNIHSAHNYDQHSLIELLTHYQLIPYPDVDKTILMANHNIGIYDYIKENHIIEPDTIKGKISDIYIRRDGKNSHYSSMKCSVQYIEEENLKVEPLLPTTSPEEVICIVTYKGGDLWIPLNFLYKK